MNTKLYKISDHFPEGSLPISIKRINQQTAVDFHDHAFYELVVILNGEGEHVAGEDCYKINQGDVFLLKPGTAHGYRDTSGLELVNVLYQPERLSLPLYDLTDSPGYHAFFELEPAMRINHGFSSKLQVSNKQLDSLKELIEHLEQEITNNTPGILF